MADSTTLVLSNTKDATADYLCSRLVDAGVPFDRFDTDAPLDAVQLSLKDDDLQFSWNGRVVRPHQIRAVVFRRPVPFTAPACGDEYLQRHASAEWAEAIEGFLANIPVNRWINHPARNFMASHKVHQLVEARRCGLQVPPWIVTTNPLDAERFLESHGPEAVAKPLASGYIERADAVDDTLIYTQSINRSHTALFDRLPGCPVLFQSRIHKRTDIRLIVMDHRFAAASLTAEEAGGAQRLDIRRDNMRDVRYASMIVPSHVTDGVAKLMGGYGLRFAALDFAIDIEDRWLFLEVNPNGQWAWLDRAGASDVGQLFIDALR